MWVIHVKDALTDWKRSATDWIGVLDILANLPGNVQGDVNIAWQPVMQ